MVRFFIVIVLGLASAFAVDPPSLSIDRTSGTTRLWLGTDTSVAATTNLTDSASWAHITVTSLTNNDGKQYWVDAEAAKFPYRFYRALSLQPIPQMQNAADFMLIDHVDRARELFYQSTDQAVVLVFVGASCPDLTQTLSQIQALNTEFAPRGVTFWVINPGPTSNRDLMAAKAAALGLNFSILQDQAQLVAKEYGASTSGEVVGINAADWSIFYRGAIQGNAASDAYLKNALSSILANQPVAVGQTPISGCSLGLTVPQTASYSKDIAPLLLNKCVKCHSPGNIGSWQMTNYAVIKQFSVSIEDKVVAGLMPPWHADPKYQKFSNDSSLSPAEAGMLVQWIRDGAPRGDGNDPLADNPPPPAVDWPLGTPDKIYTIPTQSIPANGVVDYRYINVTTTFPTDVWLRAAIVRPGNLAVVHHSLVYFGSSSIFRGLDGFFAGYVPGYEAVAFPTNTAKFLPKGTVLQFQMHYITSGTAQTDATQIGLYVMGQAPKYTLQTKSAPNIGFQIPPGAPDHEVTADYTFAKKSTIYEMSPHMHLRGSRFRYELIYPDNTTETILSVPHYEFHWQTLYRLAQPKQVPAGTVLHCVGAFDNSAQNSSNPDPTQTVMFGEQTFNEMFIGYFNFAEIP